MWTLPSRCDAVSQQWETLRSNTCFALQRNRTASVSPDQSLLWKSVVDTLQNVMETKQQPYRIIFHPSPDSPNAFLVATSSAREPLDKLWPQADKWDSECGAFDASDREAYCLAKIQSLVAAQATSTTALRDEATQDDRFRNAARSYRSLFPSVPDTERLVCFYACAYQKFQQQGWLYISENFMAFYAYVLGVETKVVIELKSILELKKERTKKGLLNDGLRIITTDQHSHLFCNLFKRDEVFDVIEQLTNKAVQRLLKNAAGDQPGAAVDARSSSQSSLDAIKATSVTKNDALSSVSLKQSIDDQKRNALYQAMFHLPPTERLLEDHRVVCWRCDKPDAQRYFGHLWIGQDYLCFRSQNRDEYTLILPYYAIRRLERLTTTNVLSAISVVTCHSVQWGLQFGAERTDVCEHVCEAIKARLQDQTIIVKRVRPFIAPLASEALLDGRQVDYGGLGLKFGYIDDAKEKGKLKHWFAYLRDEGRNVSMARSNKFLRLIRLGLPNTLRGELWEVCSGALWDRFTHENYYQSLHDKHKGAPPINADV